MQTSSCSQGSAGFLVCGLRHWSLARRHGGSDAVNKPRSIGQERSPHSHCCGPIRVLSRRPGSVGNVLRGLTVMYIGSFQTVLIPATDTDLSIGNQARWLQEPGRAEEKATPPFTTSLMNPVVMREPGSRSLVECDLAPFKVTYTPAEYGTLVL
jgi:hypothetical protein